MHSICAFVVLEIYSDSSEKSIHFITSTGSILIKSSIITRLSFSPNALTQNKTISMSMSEYNGIRYNRFPLINLSGNFSISAICLFIKIRPHYTYLGTGCIFEFDETHPFGKEEHGFTEESAPNFFGSSYSIVKGYTDRLMRMFDKNVLNVRIRMPITDEFNKRNFITKITTYEKVCSVPNSMTVLNELIPLIKKLKVLMTDIHINDIKSSMSIIDVCTE